jgi:hypothetical protein
MSIIDNALNSFSSLFFGSKMPKSFRDGEEFEKFVREVLFSRDYYELVHITANYEQNSKDFVLTSLNPDLKLRPNKSKWQFHVECKFRNVTENFTKIQKILKKAGLLDRDLTPEEMKEADKLIGPLQYLTLCDERQLRRYKFINEKEDVFICLGLYDDEAEDIRTYLVPVGDILKNTVNFQALDYYAIANNIPVEPYSAYDKAHQHDGYCVRCGKNEQRSTFCFTCWEEWFKYKNFLYSERFCNKCGIEAATSAAKPVCISCFKSQPL